MFILSEETGFHVLETCLGIFFFGLMGSPCQKVRKIISAPNMRQLPHLSPYAIHSHFISFLLSFTTEARHRKSSCRPNWLHRLSCVGFRRVFFRDFLDFLIGFFVLFQFLLSFSAEAQHRRSNCRPNWFHLQSSMSLPILIYIFVVRLVAWWSISLFFLSSKASMWNIRFTGTSCPSSLSFCPCPVLLSLENHSRDN